VSHSPLHSPLALTLTHFLAYGESAAFSFAWYCFWISKPGSQAIIATIFGNYIVSAFLGTQFAESSDFYSKCIAVALIASLTALNCSGVKESTRLINFLTIMKLCQVICIVLVGLWFALFSQAKGSGTVFAEMSLFGETNIWNFGRAMIACLFAFDGWADLNFMLEELRDAETMLPRILPFGIGLVTVCYVTANLSYFSVLSPETAMNSKSIALNFGDVAEGRILSTLMALGVAMSTMGAANGSILTGGRAFYSVARAGQAPHILATLNSKDAPAHALLAQSVWCIFLILVPGSSFSSLLDYFGPTSWIFYAFTGSAVILLRIQQPELPRPYHMPLYPLPPLILCLLSCGLVLNSILERPLFTLLAMAFIGLAFPIWHLYARCSQRPPPLPASKRSQGYEPVPGGETEVECGGGSSEMDSQGGGSRPSGRSVG
jgi:amino acid transporter